MRSGFKVRGASELERGEANLPQAREVNEEIVVGASVEAMVNANVEAMVEASRDEDRAPKDVLGVIEITELPAFTESMINEAQAVKPLPSEGFPWIG